MTEQISSGLSCEHDGAVATLTIDNGPVNTVDPSLISAFINHLTALSDDQSVRCIVIRGKENIFVAGANIAIMRELKPDTYKEMRGWLDVQRLIEFAPKPVIAAVNGHALGGGAEIALACDLRIMHDRATIGFPEMNLGLFPGAGGSQRLPRLLGAHVAKRLMFDGTRLDATGALKMGLVDMVAGADFDEVVDRESTRWAALPTLTIGLVKEGVYRGAQLPFDEAILVEEELVMRNLKTADVVEGLQAFLDKREPRFTGR